MARENAVMASVSRAKASSVLPWPSSAAGSPGLVTAAMIKPGAAVVGAGTSFSEGRLLSDIADDVENLAGWITPRIGGVGPMTRAMLVRNTVLAAEKVR